VAVIVLATEAMEHLPVCLSSMSDQSWPHYTLYLVDNASDDGTAEYVASTFPQVEILRAPQRLGYRSGNRFAMQRVTGDYVCVTNEDVEVKRDWLLQMVRALQEDPTVGIVTPQILHYQQRDKINAAGNTIHFTGMYGGRGNYERCDRYQQAEDLGTVSGACFMIRGQLLDELGGFSEDFDALDTGWHASFEDVDLAWRARLRGWRVRYVPESVMYHKWIRQRMSPGWYASYEWGRYLVTLRNFELRTLLLLAPSLGLIEAMTWLYGLLRGREFVGAKWRVVRWLAANWDQVRQMRREVQQGRSVPDSAIMRIMSPTIRIGPPAAPGKAGGVVDGLVNLFFSLHYAGLKLLVIDRDRV
jgi:GT2 family glycosyltransferase